MAKPVMTIHTNDIELTREEHNLIHVILASVAMDGKVNTSEEYIYISNDLEAHFDVLYSEYAFSTWVRRMRSELKKVYGYELNENALLASFHKHIKIQPNKEMLAMFKRSRTKCEEKLKEIKSDKGLTAEEKAKKEKHINEIIKNLNESIARQLTVKSTYLGITK